MQPTPNGPMHLGHASGPYLRADVLARHLRRAGNRVRLITGSDVYENWILLDGLATGRSPEETCAHYHQQIEQSLRAFGLGLDAYVDPRAPEHAAGYIRVHEELIDRLVARGQARAVRERFPVSTETGRYVVGVWLLGRCPNCGTDGGGNACEECGYHYQPGEILEPRSRLDEGRLEWRDETCLFLFPEPVSAVLDLVRASSAPPDMREVAVHYVEETGARIRLTIPSEWGIKGRHANRNTVLCNTFYGYCVYTGSLASAPSKENAFARESGVTTIGVFGIDNAIGGIVVPAATAVAHGALKPFDVVCASWFLELEGRKFSTSRGHLVRLDDILERTSVSSDELRYALCGCSPEEGPSSFRVSEFIADVNRLRELLAVRVRPALDAVGPPPSDEAEVAKVEAALRAQEASLDPAALSVRRTREVLSRWLEQRASGQGYWWLKGLALLAAPILPEFARCIWAALGGTDHPSAAAFAEPTQPLYQRTPSVAPPLRAAEIVPHVHRATEAEAPAVPSAL